MRKAIYAIRPPVIQFGSMNTTLQIKKHSGQENKDKKISMLNLTNIYQPQPGDAWQRTRVI
jgi:hypothetical protein